jgi:pimeloyl-ACP methyl ester carboxylesterase
MNDSTMHLLLAALVLTPDMVRPGRAELRRRADWGFRLKAAADSSAFEVTGLREGSSAEKAGLRSGDRVVGVNGQRVGAGASPLRGYRSGDTLRFEVQREGRTGSVVFTACALPEESLPGCDVRYGSVATPLGYRVRTVLTRPAGATGKLPTIVFLPWLSCDAIENPGRGDGWMQMLHGIAERSGWALYRVEKPGVGDSEGPPCSQNDLDTDLAAFRAALAQVRAMEDVDSSRIVLFGGSIGGGLAPVLAAEGKVAGVIAVGGFSRTWYQHMLEIERARLTYEGTAPADIDRAVTGFATFYDLFLRGKLTPAQVIAQRPDLEPLWYDAPDGQYGRPAAYYQQVEDLDVAGAWARIDVPVLVLHGEYDWIMSRAEAEHAVEVVNAHAPGQASLAILPRTDHHFGVYRSPVDAYREQGGEVSDEVVTRIVEWLGAHF